VAVEDGKLTLAGTEAEHAFVARAFGSESIDFQTYCLRQLLNIIPEGTTEDYTFDTNAALAMLASIAPANELEAMLAVQMVATHHMAMLTTRKAVHSQAFDVRQANANLSTKFSRTFTAQIEALGRHRRGGKQVVEHVHISDGGQAVFANSVTTGVGGRNG
jgi:hypothetical protein